MKEKLTFQIPYSNFLSSQKMLIIIFNNKRKDIDIKLMQLSYILIFFFIVDQLLKR